jgi:hypothetical protein
MRLIRISDNVLVNPEEISAVIKREISVGENSLVVVVDGIEYISTVSPTDLLKELIDSGMEVENLVYQYWAG